MRIAVITAVWGRYHLTALYWRWIAHLHRWWAAHEVIAVAAVSDLDHEHLALTSDAVTVWAENRPLGRKFNAALAAAKGLNPDAVMVMGSDDFLCKRTARALLRTIGDGCTYVGLQDLYFLHGPSGAMQYWPGYPAPRTGEPIGPGRIMRREVLDACDWDLWDDRQHKGCDYGATVRAAAIVQPELVSVRAIGGCGLDCKTAENLNPWRSGYEAVPNPQPVLELLPPEIRDGLTALRRVAA